MRTRDLFTYLALLASAIFVCSISYMWLSYGTFWFNHWCWPEVIAGILFLIMSIERLISWGRYHWKHRNIPLRRKVL